MVSQAPLSPLNPVEVTLVCTTQSWPVRLWLWPRLGLPSNPRPCTPPAPALWMWPEEAGTGREPWVQRGHPLWVKIRGRFWLSLVLGREDYVGREACMAPLPGMESHPSPAWVAEPPGHSLCLPLHPLGSALPLCPQ